MGRGLINFLPLKKKGEGVTRGRGAYLRRELKREFTVIKQKHRAGQLRRQNSVRFWILGTGLRIPCQQDLDFGLESLARFQIP